MYDLMSPVSPRRPVFQTAFSTPGSDEPAISSRQLIRMLDVIDYGMLLVIEDGHVVYANQSARSELDDQHPLQLMGRELRVRSPKDVVTLRGALHAATQRGLQKLITVGGEGGNSMAVSVIPMTDVTAEGEPSALIAFGKRRVCEELSTEAFARHHKLTATELQVLKLLCSGMRPTQIAAAQGVALCTVRTQIGCIREKTQTASIGALLRQVAKLPPMLSLLRNAA